VTDVATSYTRDFVLAALPPGAKRVLEVGCGGGALAAELRRAGLAVVAIDSDPARVEEAKARGVDAREAAWPHFSDGRFDAILFTRSLHHVGDLAGSVAAAFAALAANGRVIVEDFLAEGCSGRSECWFSSLAATLDRGSLLAEPTGHLAEVLGRVPPDAEDHHLHSSTAIEAALRAHAEAVRAEGSACYFRYVLPALEEARPELGQALLDHERELIQAGIIDALGRRYVATAAG
jgi:SAM-dependent methyltransferase